MLGKLLFNYTLRDKNVKIPTGDNITSPATGKILKIVKITDKNKIKIRKGLLGAIESTTKGVIKDGYLVSIFLRLHDNHINRAPIDATVVDVKHTKGKFKPASSLKALQNEKTEILLDSYIGRLKLIQIAGYVARRIVTYITPGQTIKKGQTLGLIKLGSQVSMVLPSNVKIKVKKGQKVKSGTTIIGEF